MSAPHSTVTTVVTPTPAPGSAPNSTEKEKDIPVSTGEKAAWYIAMVVCWLGGSAIGLQALGATGGQIVGMEAVFHVLLILVVGSARAAGKDIKLGLNTITYLGFVGIFIAVGVMGLFGYQGMERKAYEAAIVNDMTLKAEYELDQKQAAHDKFVGTEAERAIASATRQVDTAVANSGAADVVAAANGLPASPEAQAVVAGKTGELFDSWTPKKKRVSWLPDWTPDMSDLFPKLDNIRPIYSIPLWILIFGVTLAAFAAVIYSILRVQSGVGMTKPAPNASWFDRAEYTVDRYVAAWAGKGIMVFVMFIMVFVMIYLQLPDTPQPGSPNWTYARMEAREAKAEADKAARLTSLAAAEAAGHSTRPASRPAKGAAKTNNNQQDVGLKVVVEKEYEPPTIIESAPKMMVSRLEDGSHVIIPVGN